METPIAPEIVLTTTLTQRLTGRGVKGRGWKVISPCYTQEVKKAIKASMILWLLMLAPVAASFHMQHSPPHFDRHCPDFPIWNFLYRRWQLSKTNTYKRSIFGDVCRPHCAAQGLASCALSGPALTSRPPRPNNTHKNVAMVAIEMAMPGAIALG
jgi:hypothetical protein